jgi:hypothetical protein
MSIQMNAQVPGYLGKRWFFEAELGVNFSSLISGGNQDANDGLFRILQPLPRVSANWVIGRHNFLSMQADYRFLLEDAEILESFPGQPALRYLIETKTIQLGYYRIRNHGTPALAPIGSFIGYKLIYGQTMARPVRNLTLGERFTGVERAAYKLVEGYLQEEFLAVAVSVGKRRIINDKHTVSINLDLGLRSLVFSEPLLLSARRSETATFYDGTEAYNGVFAHLTIGYGWLK